MADEKPSFGLPENWEKIPESERKKLQKPLIFPNNEKLFKRFTFGVTLGQVFSFLWFTTSLEFYNLFHSQCDYISF